MSQAARLAGVDRTTLYRLMGRHHPTAIRVGVGHRTPEPVDRIDLPAQGTRPGAGPEISA